MYFLIFFILRILSYGEQGVKSHLTYMSKGSNIYSPQTLIVRNNSDVLVLG